MIQNVDLNVNPLKKTIQEDSMKQVKVTAVNRVFRRIAVVACVAALGVGAAACGDNSVTPQSPSGGTTPAAGTTAKAGTTPSAVTTPSATTNPNSGGAGF